MIVLDTCAIIWDALDASRLTPKAEKAIEQNAGELVICDISIWEIAMLIKRKRLVIDLDTSGFINLLLQSRNFRIQEITPEIAELSVNFTPECNGSLVNARQFFDIHAEQLRIDGIEADLYEIAKDRRDIAVRMKESELIVRVYNFAILSIKRLE